MPPAVAAAAIAVVGTAASTIGQIQQAKAVEKTIRNQQAVRTEEIKDAATADLFDRARAARREQARIQTAAGAAGLNAGSPTIENLLLDSLTQQQLASERTISNEDIQQQSNTAAAAQALAQNASRPSLLGATLKIATAGASAYAGASKGGS